MVKSINSQTRFQRAQYNDILSFVKTFFDIGGRNYR